MAAGNTFDIIGSTTLANSTTSTYTFSSIPSTYNELYVVVAGQTTTANDNSLAFQFNGDTSATQYAWYAYDGNNAVVSATGSLLVNQPNIQFGLITSVGQSVSIGRIIGYSTSGIYKGVMGEGGFNTRVRGYSGFWNSTAVINSVTVYIYPNAANFVSGSTITLYGITRA